MQNNLTNSNLFVLGKNCPLGDPGAGFYTGDRHTGSGVFPEGAMLDPGVENPFGIRGADTGGREALGYMCGAHSI